jgi:hypothetical protein
MSLLLWVGAGMALLTAAYGCTRPRLNEKKEKKEKKVVGLRKPNTSVGTWTGAYVAGIDSDDNIIAAFFEDSKDWIGHPASWREVEETLADLAQKGWTPMTREDLCLTAGVANH